MTSLGTCKAFAPDGSLCPGELIALDQDEQVGCLLTAVCDQCGTAAAVPVARVNPQARRAMLAAQAGFPERFAGQPFRETPGNLQARQALRRWVDGWPASAGRAPALYGEAGRGKSHLLVALCERLIAEKNVPVMFRSMAKLLDELRDSLDRSGEFQTLWGRVVSVPVLALDDVGAERATDWQGDRLARLVDERWENERPIILATNVAPALWGRAFDARTASRLAGMTFPVEVGGDDARVVNLASQRAKAQS